MTGVCVLATATVTAAVVRFPDPSRATAASTCAPLTAVVVSQTTAYGGDVTSSPKLAPSI